MSTKKALRQKEKQLKEERRGKWNPATVFLLLIAAALLAFGLFAYFTNDSEPPWPGAVWSPAHQHWH